LIEVANKNTLSVMRIAVAGPANTGPTTTMAMIIAVFTTRYAILQFIIFLLLTNVLSPYLSFLSIR
jgi:hypothetical protein